MPNIFIVKQTLGQEYEDGGRYAGDGFTGCCCYRGTTVGPSSSLLVVFKSFRSTGFELNNWGGSFPESPLYLPVLPGNLLSDIGPYLFNAVIQENKQFMPYLFKQRFGNLVHEFPFCPFHVGSIA